MIGKAVYAILYANATVAAAVGTRIFPDMATQDAAYPFIIYTQEGVAPSDTKEGVSSLDVVSVSVVVFATTKASAEDIAEAARAAMDGKSGTYGTIDLQEVRFVNQVSARMDWDKHIFITEQEYRIRQNR